MGVRDPRFTAKEHTKALSLRNVDVFQKALGILKEPKVIKSLKQTEKMFKAIKASGTIVADVLGAFIGAGSAKDVFGDVVSAYADYLSDTFWSEIVSSIDYASITTAVTDILGPIFSEIGIVIGNLIEAAPIGISVGGALGYLIYGPIGALVGGLLGFGIEALTTWLDDILGREPPPERPIGMWEPAVQEHFFEETGLVALENLEEYAEWFRDVYLNIPTVGEFTDPTVGGHRPPELQHGTDYISRTGLIKAHVGESITPSLYSGRIEELLEQQNRYLKKQLESKEWDF